jgi:hypothetical protein
MEPHLILQAWWSKTDAGIETSPASASELAQLEKRYGITLPHDFRQYLAECVPVSENWDAEDGNWWPIARIRSLSDEYNHTVTAPIASQASRHLLFLDYMMWSWAWAISCANDATFGRVALIGGPEEVYVAGSFTEFVQRYTTDWMNVSRLPKAKPRNGRIRDWLFRR